MGDSIGADFQAQGAVIRAPENGYLEVVKYLVSIGAVLTT